MTTFWKSEPDINEGLEAVADLISHQAAGASPYIASYLNRMILSQGKMLRPALVLVGARFGTHSDSKRVYDQAALIEMIHIASLIHDDIIDSATSRRGRPTLYKELGARRAVIAGDFVLSRALALIASDHDGSEPAAAVSRAFCRLCNGEIDQDSEEWNFFISRAHYLRRIAGKTAAMFALSGYLGANTAGADPFIQYQLHQIGYNIGMAFQIQDDVLDMTGNQENLGKPVGRDLRSGVCTLPVIYALEAEPNGHLAQKLKGKKSISQRKAKKLIGYITDLGGIERAKETAGFYSDRALSLIDALPNQDISAMLTRMLERLHIRNH